MAGPHDTVISGYYVLGFNGPAGFKGDGFRVSNVSGTVRSLALTGFGTAEIGAITATDSAYLATEGGFPVCTVVPEGCFSGQFESQGLTITGGGMLKTHQLDIVARTVQGYTGPIDIKDGTILYGDAVRIRSVAPDFASAHPDLAAVSAPVTVSGGAIKAGGTLSLLVGDTVTSPTASVATTVILDNGGLYATGEAGPGDLLIGTTIDGNPANPLQRFTVKADGASHINSARDTLIGLYAPATLEARGTTDIMTGGDAFIGVLEPAHGSSVLLSGAGVKWDAAKRFLIGGNGAGNVLTLEEGATLNVADRLTLGVNPGGGGNLVIKSGATVTADGKAGPGTLSVDIGDSAGSFGDIVVKGKGSMLISKRVLAVGFSGMGGLSVSDGGAVDVQDALIRVGRNAGSQGTVRVSGTDSQLTGDNATLFAGFLGTGNVFVSDHGLLRVKATNIGSMASGDGTVSLDGASEESNLGKVIAGNIGTGRLVVAHGKVMADAVQIGAMADSQGFVTLQDNAELDVKSVVIGLSGTGTATVKSGAKLMINDPGAGAGAGSVLVGNRKGSTGTLNISGAGSLVKGDFGLVIGEAGTGTVNISEGGKLDIGSQEIVIGSEAGSDGTLKVDSSNGGSSIALSHLTVGLFGTGTLELVGSGVFDKRTIGPEANTVIIGKNEHSNGTLKLSNLTLDLTGGARDRIIIGDKGSGTLVVGANARVNSDNTTVGLGATGEHHLLVSGQGAEYHVADTLRVGSGTDATGSVEVTDGGKLFVNTLNVGGPESTPRNAMFTVSNGAEINGALMGAANILVQANDGLAQFEVGTQAIVHFGTIQVKSPRSFFDVIGNATLMRTDTSKPYGLDISDHGRFAVIGTGNSLDLGPIRVASGGDIFVVGGSANDQPIKFGDVVLQYGSAENKLDISGDGNYSFTKLDLQAGTAEFSFRTKVTIDDLQTAQGGVLPLLKINSGANVKIGGSGGAGDVVANLNTTIDDASLEVRGTSFTIPAGDAGVTVMKGGTLTAFTTSFAVNGTLEIADGGQLFRVHGPVTLGPGGTLSATGNGASIIGVTAITMANRSLLLAASNASFEISNSVNLGTGSTIDAVTGTVRIGSGAFIAPTDPKTGKPVTDGVLNDPGFIIVKTGGLLSGIGALKGSLINGGGIVHAGNSPGTIAVTGDYLQGPGSTLLLSVGSTDYSKLIVGGAAVFAGGKIVIDVAPGTALKAGTQYQFVSAVAGVTGQVDQVIAPTAFADFKTSLSGGALSLTVIHRAGSYAAAAATANQRSVGQEFDSVDSTTNSPATRISNLLLNQTATAIPASLDQLSGEVHASGIVALVEDSAFGRDAMLDRANETGGSGIWARAATLDGQLDADGNAVAVRRSGEQYVMGADVASGPARAGIAGVYGNLRHDLAARASNDRAKSYGVGAYAGLRQGRLSATAALNYSWNDMSTRRAVTTLGLNEVETANYTARSLQASGQLALSMPVGGATLLPFARLDYISVDTGHIAERGGAATIIGSGNISAAFTSLGLRGAALARPAGRIGIQLRSSASWQHAIGDTRASARLGLAGAQLATVESVGLASDALVVSASADVRVGRATLGVGYNGHVASTAHENRVSARLSFEF